MTTIFNFTALINGSFWPFIDTYLTKHGFYGCFHLEDYEVKGWYNLVTSDPECIKCVSDFHGAEGQYITL